jgi:hypothetical protein
MRWVLGNDGLRALMVYFSVNFLVPGDEGTMRIMEQSSVPMNL